VCAARDRRNEFAESPLRRADRRDILLALRQRFSAIQEGRDVQEAVHPRADAGPAGDPQGAGDAADPSSVAGVLGAVRGDPAEAPEGPVHGESGSVVHFVVDRRDGIGGDEPRRRAVSEPRERGLLEAVARDHRRQRRPVRRVRGAVGRGGEAGGGRRAARVRSVRRPVCSTRFGRSPKSSAAIRTCCSSSTRSPGWPA